MAVYPADLDFSIIYLSISCRLVFYICKSINIAIQSENKSKNTQFAFKILKHYARYPSIHRPMTPQSPFLAVAKVSFLLFAQPAIFKYISNYVARTIQNCTDSTQSVQHFSLIVGCEIYRFPQPAHDAPFGRALLGLRLEPTRSPCVLCGYKVGTLLIHRDKMECKFLYLRCVTLFSNSVN